MGPEIWKNRPYSYTSDTWAIGCLLYELAALAVPFEARSMSELRYKVEARGAGGRGEGGGCRREGEAEREGGRGERRSGR